MNGWNLKTSRCALWVLRSVVVLGGCGDHESPLQPPRVDDKARDDSSDAGVRSVCSGQEDGAPPLRRR
jgi:hypothetical protein